MKKVLTAFLVALVVAFAIGCSTLKTPHTVAPGSTVAATPLDSDTYNLLLLTKGIIDGVRTDLANNVFTTLARPFVVQAENELVTSYNSLDSAYGPYHTAVVAGTATAAQAAAVTAATAQVQAATQKLATAKATPGAKAIGRQLVYAAMSQVDASKDSPIDLNKIPNEEVIR